MGCPMVELPSSEEIRASEATLRGEIRASGDRQNKRSDELEAHIKAINDLLLDTLLADQSRDAQQESIAWPTSAQEEAG